MVPVPDEDLPVTLPRGRRPSTAPAIRSTAIRPGRTCTARNAASRRGARPTPWTRSSIRPGTSRASPIRGSTTAPTDRKVGRPLAAGRPVYRRRRARDPAPALLALLHPRDEGDRPRRPRRAVRRPVHARHGGARDLSRADGEWVEPARGRRSRPRATSAARRSTATGAPVEIGADREDVEVEEEHHRPRRHHGQLRRRRRALVHAVGFAARARRRMDRARRAGRLAVHAAAVAAGRRGGRDRRSRAGGAAGAVRRGRASRCARPRTARWRKVSDAIEKLHFNVCVAHLYEFANAFGASIGAHESRADADYRWAVREAAEILVQLFHPMMPHLAEECWAALGHNTLVATRALAGARAGAAGREHHHAAGAGQRQEARRRHGARATPRTPRSRPPCWRSTPCSARSTASRRRR